MSTAAPSPAPGRPLRVLVLDDDPMFGRQLVFALERNAELSLAGVAVSSAEGALAALRGSPTPFDIFLVDQRLGPGPDGISVLQQLLEESPRSGAVVFTVAGDLASGRRAHQVGAYRYLHKPFSVEELLLVLQTLREWLQTREEMGWLHVINAFAEDAQKLHRREAIEQIIVRRGLDLGFDRAQLWVSPNGGTVVMGAAGASRSPAGEFAGAGPQLATSPYLTRVLASPEPVIFRGLEHGTIFPAGQWAGNDQRLPVGEWVGLPLWAGERVRGALLLDRLEERGDISADRSLLQALSLFGRQVAAALERATLAGEERRRSLETAILAGIGRLISGEAAGRPYAELLERVRQEVGKLVAVENFYVAIRSAASGWLDHLISVEGGELQSHDPGRGVQELMGRVITLNRPVRLRKGQALGQGRRPGRGDPAHCEGQSGLSQIGVPLQVEGQAVGALVVQGDGGEGQYGEAQQRILEAVAAQIAGPLHNRRLREAAEETSRRLSVMQQAGKALMALDDPSEDHLWHTALTVITAGFGLGYNLAALFMLKRGGTLLRGSLGIGQRTLRAAQRAWSSAIVREMTFEQYRELLERARLGPPTPIDAPIRSIEIPLAEAGALAEALSQRGKERHIRVPASEFTAQLPQALQAILPRWEYEVLPLVAGEHRLGVVVVGNPHLRRPLDEMPFDQLAAWVAQVGIIRESWRQREAGEDLAAVSREVLAGAGSRTLQETLNLLCKSARTLMRASCAVIYPFADFPPDAPPRLDMERAGSDGLRYPLQPPDQPTSGGITEQLLATRALIAVEDVAELSWYSQTHPSNSFLRREDIQAFFAAVILERASGAPRGLLYVSYRSTQGFSERDKATASALADLAGQAIRNHDDRAVIQARADEAEAARRERERELTIVADLLRGTLAIKYEQPEQALDELARLILVQGASLLRRDDIRLGLVLRLWVRDQASGEAREIRREFFLVDDTMVQDDQADLYAGITGLAFKTGEDQLVEDVTTPEWRDTYVSQSSGQTRSELDVLICLEERTLGLISVESRRVGAFSLLDRDALRRLADGAALALDTGQHQRQLQELLKAARPMIEAHDLGTTLRAVLDQLLQAAPEIDVVTIWYWDGERRALVPGVFHGVRDTTRLRNDRTILPETVLGRVMQSPDPIWAEHAARSPLAGRFVADEAIISAVAFSLRVGDGAEGEATDDGEAITLADPDEATRRVVGMLFLNYRHHHRFTRHEQTLFPLVAAIVAACIRDALALEQLRKQRQRLAATTALARAVGATVELDETLRTMLATVRGLLTTPTREIQLCVLLADERSDQLTFAPASWAFYNWAYIEANQALPLNNGRRTIAARVANAALATGRSTAVNVHDVRNDPDYLPANATTRAQLSLALLSPDTDALLGVLVIEANQASAFSHDDELLVEALGPIISLAIKGAREQEERRFNASVAGVTAWVGEIAHDIGTAISDAQRTIYRLRGELGDEQVSRLAAMNENLSRLSALVGAPLKGASSSTFDLNQWLPTRVRQLIAGRAGPPVELQFHLAPQPLYVSVPAALLERVLGHLIRNGRQARREGCVFTICTAHEGRSAAISVANNGPPIPPELIDRLFFDRIANPGRAEGEGGRGLLLSRWMMRHMGGDLTLASPESPVTFGLWLPLAP